MEHIERNFSDEVKKIFENILVQQQQNFAYNSLMAAFSGVFQQTQQQQQFQQSPIGINNSILNSSADLSLTLGSEIPREDIECDIDLIIFKSFCESLRKLKSSLNGYHGKKYGFRQMAEEALKKPAYLASPNPICTKRKRNTSMDSIDSASPLTPPSSLDQDDSATKRVRLIDLNSSNVSSEDDEGQLVIDWNDHDESKPSIAVKSEIIKEEQPEEAATVQLQTPKTTESNSKPLRFLVDRMKGIQRKKPKVSVDDLDVTYHSNMARRFPGSELRSEAQQARRDKNTIAARNSRNKNKVYEETLRYQAIDAIEENIKVKREAACLRVYANELMRINGFPEANFTKMWEENFLINEC